MIIIRLNTLLIQDITSCQATSIFNKCRILPLSVVLTSPIWCIELHGPSMLAGRPIWLGFYNQSNNLSVFSVINLLKHTESGLITRSDQTVRALHDFNSWLRVVTSCGQEWRGLGVLCCTIPSVKHFFFLYIKYFTLTTDEHLVLHDS